MGSGWKSSGGGSEWFRNELKPFRDWLNSCDHNAIRDTDNRGHSEEMSDGNELVNHWDLEECSPLF